MTIVAKLIFTQLGHLDDQIQTPLPDWIQQQFLPELQSLAQQTTETFDQLANQITDLNGKPSSLTQQITTLEQQLLSLRAESRNYPLQPLISFSATFSTLKTIAQNLDQITQK